MNGYPITLVDLANTSCVVVGGGEVAARKVQALCEAGAHPVVVSPVLCDALRCQAEAGKIEVIEREYRPGDVAGVRLIIAATDEPAINEAVWQEAQAAGCLVNVVDEPTRCNFYVPATVRRGALTLSVSTSGYSPALARRIRQTLERQFEPSYEPYLDLLGGLRPIVQEQVADPAVRKLLWESLLDSDILELLHSGAAETALQRAHEIVESFCREQTQR